ncbi:fasciclin domain-containing protein [Arenibacter sp. GZD96]|uniref:fasciclin domain-containing protein n=1 Tax=Aurantibrevibacter litoralis TaxID=3106030 RepID=UPI002AFE3F54|nr:fasciclin domain-containing protein [Arenibacter sp. GZD-96]MEA1784526.1 fasciclin domain-containing protein [Arenibacter sp. GZD-96]
MKLVKTMSTLALVGVIATSCGQTKKETTEILDQASLETTEVRIETPQAVAEPNIVEVAVSNENFTTLVAAVKAAGLVETLSSAGPFTVFAPTNDGFSKLPEGTVAGLLKPERKDQLTGVLTYHVVSGKFEAATVIDAIKKNNGKFTVTTVQGGTIDLSLKDGNVILTDANGGTATVVIADVAASNGVIHAIDAVILPK